MSAIDNQIHRAMDTWVFPTTNEGYKQLCITTKLYIEHYGSYKIIRRSHLNIEQIEAAKCGDSVCLRPNPKLVYTEIALALDVAPQMLLEPFDVPKADQYRSEVKRAREELFAQLDSMIAVIRQNLESSREKLSLQAGLQVLEESRNCLYTRIKGLT